MDVTETDDVKAVTVKDIPGESDPFAQIIAVVKPLIDEYTQSQERQNMRRMALEEKALDADLKLKKMAIMGGAVAILCVFALAIYMVSQGLDDSAVGLVQLFVAVALAMLSGYGIRHRKRSGGAPED